MAGTKGADRFAAGLLRKVDSLSNIHLGDFTRGSSGPYDAGRRYDCDEEGKILHDIYLLLGDLYAVVGDGGKRRMWSQAL